jgi:hypothetical protein
MALPNRPVAPQKKRLNDSALEALASRMANDKNVQKPGTVATSPRTPASPAKALPDLSGKPSAGSVTTSPRPPGSGAPAKPAAPDESSLDYLSRLRAEQDRVTEATKADLAAGKAKASLDAGARAGAAGMGLSGATAALKSDIGRQQDRGAVLALDELSRRQADQEFQAIGQQAAILDYEDAYDLDMDGDGMVGGQKVGGKVGDGDPENDPKVKPADEEDAKRALEAAKASLSTQDLFINDRDTGAGTKEEPYTFDSMAALAEWFRETTGMEPVFDSQSYGGQLVIQDQFGNWYTLTDQEAFQQRGLAPLRLGD